MAAQDVEDNVLTTSSLAYADSRDAQRQVGSPMGSANSRSWKELEDGSAGGGGIVRHTTTHDTKTDSLGDIELLNSGYYSLAGHGAPGTADGEATTGRGAEESPVTYKVYKRRWFGLVQLVLMNIIVSWDVSRLLCVASASGASISHCRPSAGPDPFAIHLLASRAEDLSDLDLPTGYLSQPGGATVLETDNQRP